MDMEIHPCVKDFQKKKPCCVLQIFDTWVDFFFSVHIQNGGILYSHILLC